MQFNVVLQNACPKTIGVQIFLASYNAFKWYFCCSQPPWHYLCNHILHFGSPLQLLVLKGNTDHVKVPLSIVGCKISICEFWPLLFSLAIFYMLLFFLFPVAVFTVVNIVWISGAFVQCFHLCHSNICFKKNLWFRIKFVLLSIWLSASFTWHF